MPSRRVLYQINVFSINTHMPGIHHMKKNLIAGISNPTEGKPEKLWKKADSVLYR